ncbi:MAG: hypothetical protein JJT94_09925 [Bernardetiaceae bacterium]|nr:hypothetical protein [Bernardetiaceae bacterium]
MRILAIILFVIGFVSHKSWITFPSELAMLHTYSLWIMAAGFGLYFLMIAKRKYATWAAVFVFTVVFLLASSLLNVPILADVKVYSTWILLLCFVVLVWY